MQLYHPTNCSRQASGFLRMARQKYNRYLQGKELLEVVLGQIHRTENVLKSIANSSKVCKDLTTKQFESFLKFKTMVFDKLESEKENSE